MDIVIDIVIEIGIDIDVDSDMDIVIDIVIARGIDIDVDSDMDIDMDTDNQAFTYHDSLTTILSFGDLKIHLHMDRDVYRER